MPFHASNVEKVNEIWIKGEWTRKALYQVGLVSGHSRNQVKRGSPDFSISQCRERSDFTSDWQFLNFVPAESFSKVFHAAGIFFGPSHCLCHCLPLARPLPSRYQDTRKKWAYRKWDKNDFLTNVSVGPDLASALPVFLLSLSLSSLLLSGFSEILFSFFFIFRCGNLAFRFLFSV